MTSRSATISSNRPFYDLHAEAYDVLITDPVDPWVDAIDRHLHEAGSPSVSLLDAGCGTGRHAEALAGRGYRVTLMDASKRLLEIAARRCPGLRTVRDDICDVALADTFDAVACRGVLNDLIEDAERDQALACLGRLTADGGLLFLDVREADASRVRADGTWRTTEAELDDGSRITFVSRPTWRAGRIHVDERYEFSDADGKESPPREYTFQMRPWTRAELESRLRHAGFGYEVPPKRI